MPREPVAPPEDGLKTAVLLCQDLEGPEYGLALGQLRSFLHARFAGIGVTAVPHLCEEPGRLPRAIAPQGADRVVLGLCSGSYPQVELQAQARKAGLDPFGLEVVPLGTLCASAYPRPQAARKAKALLAAAVARARAYQDSTPEQAKPYFLPWGRAVGRRSLFTLPPIGYRAVPGFAEERCAAPDGCQLCVQACPRDALGKQEGRIYLLNKTRCEGCGICLTACPREAVSLPGWSLPQFEAQIATLLDPACTGPEPFGLLLACHRAFGRLEEPPPSAYSPLWLPVAVPCLRMVPPAWALQALAHGVGEVALLLCGRDCPFGQQEAIRGKAAFSRELLGVMGQPPDKVRLISASDNGGLPQALHTPLRQGRPCPRHRSREHLPLHTTQGALEAIQCLAEGVAIHPGQVLHHPHSPFGIVELRTEGCTGCLSCGAACPTGALASERDGDHIVLTYAASLCNGCALCAHACPEAAGQVLTVQRATDLDALSRGRVVLHRERLAICESCGDAFISRGILQRIGAQIGKNNDALAAALGRYCPACRMDFALSARRAT